MKRATRQCDKCLSEISKSNFNRHTAKCTGAGTWVQQEQQRKDSLQHSTHVCDVCGKILLTKSGLTGHKYRSHVNKDKAAAYGELGRTRKQEMIAAGHIFRGCVHTPETKEKLSLLMIDKLQKKPFWSKREIYNGVTLDSSYEVRVAKTLDEHGILWERPHVGLKWFDGKQNRHYLPDFYLPAYDVFLDPKNDFLIPRDAVKIQSASQQNNVRIIVLNKNELTWETIVEKINAPISQW